MAKPDRMRFWVVLLVTLHLIAAIIVFAAIAGDNPRVQQGVEWLGTAVSATYAVLTVATVLGWVGSIALRVIRRRQRHRTGTGACAHVEQSLSRPTH